MDEVFPPSVRNYKSKSPKSSIKCGLFKMMQLDIRQQALEPNLMSLFQASRQMVLVSLEGYNH